jgi:butyryl-CoA dehydrogenase
MWYQITEEQKKWQEIGKRLAKQIEPIAREIDAKGGFPHEATRILRDAGLLRMLISKKYGGEETDITSHCLAIEELTKGDLGLANWVGEQNIPRILEQVGTEEQKNKYIPATINERKMWCMSATEKSVGSDLGMIETRAIRDKDNYIINGKKVWATTGGYADFFIIFTTTDPTKKIKGLTAFIVEKGTPGFEIGREHVKMGWRTQSTTELSLKDVRVPIQNRLGEEGGGFNVFVRMINIGRLLIGVQGLGLSEAAMEYVANYAKQRIQFGHPIAEFEGIRFMIADMASEIEASRALVYTTAWLMDKKNTGDPEVTKLAAMSKYTVSDFAMKITTDAVQILGATGYSNEHPVEKMMRDAKGLQLADGSNQIMRTVVAASVLGK